VKTLKVCCSVDVFESCEGTCTATGATKNLPRTSLFLQAIFLHRYEQLSSGDRTNKSSLVHGESYFHVHASYALRLQIAISAIDPASPSLVVATSLELHRRAPVTGLQVALPPKQPAGRCWPLISIYRTTFFVSYLFSSQYDNQAV
jgi:hypothetical protein